MLTYISIHAPQWGATVPNCIMLAVATFQSTHPSGVRPPQHHRRRVSSEISIHAPQWGATQWSFDRRLDVLFQSTHPSGVRRTEQNHLARLLPISIHAPQWGATLISRAPSCRADRFQSTHPSGVRLLQCSYSWRPRYFNPRTPVGCDPDQHAHDAIAQVISIHAPQWGATVISSRVTVSILFQSTHPSGVRLMTCDTMVRLVHISIHAPQWGATRANSRRALRTLHFNPRTPVGCDADAWQEIQKAGISIHAPQWGATPSSHAVASICSLFQSTHPSGVRRRGEIPHGVAPLFQSTHPSGVRRTFYINVQSPNGFQSTHPSGVRRGDGVSEAERLDISIHAPQWGATGIARIHAKPISFQSTHPSGVRLITRYSTFANTPLFQSTHPSGVRRGFQSRFRPHIQFQSTHPSGVRPREWA